MDNSAKCCLHPACWINFSPCMEWGKRCQSSQLLSRPVPGRERYDMMWVNWHYRKLLWSDNVAYTMPRHKRLARLGCLFHFNGNTVLRFSPIVGPIWIEIALPRSEWKQGIEAGKREGRERKMGGRESERRTREWGRGEKREGQHADCVCVCVCVCVCRCWMKE